MHSFQSGWGQSSRDPASLAQCDCPACKPSCPAKPLVRLVFLPLRPCPAGCTRLTCTATPSSPCSCCSTCCSWCCALCCSCSASSRGCSLRVSTLRCMRPPPACGQHSAERRQQSVCFLALCPSVNLWCCAAVLYAAGSSYYWYLTFLGYSALPFLERTEVRLLTCCVAARGLGSCIWRQWPAFGQRCHSGHGLRWRHLCWASPLLSGAEACLAAVLLGACRCSFTP